MYAATGDARFKDRADYIIKELSEVNRQYDLSFEVENKPQDSMGCGVLRAHADRQLLRQCLSRFLFHLTSTRIVC